MARPDPGLGLPTSFPSKQFRDAVRFSMQMGLPPDPNKRPVFVFPSSGRTYWRDGVELSEAPRVDRDGKPLNPNVEIRESLAVRRQLDCAIEITPADDDEIPVGSFRQTKAIVTLLDVDYALAKGCREMIYNGDRYLFGYEPEALGMFDVGVHTLIFYALDES